MRNTIQRQSRVEFEPTVDGQLKLTLAIWTRPVSHPGSKNSITRFDSLISLKEGWSTVSKGSPNNRIILYGNG